MALSLEEGIPIVFRSLSLFLRDNPLCGRIIVGCIVVCVVGIVVVAARLLIRIVRRSRAQHELGVRVPWGIRVRRSRTPRQIGEFVLGYPRWDAAKKDGTRDRRTNDVSVLYDPSVLEVGTWRFRGRDPFLLYDFVNACRDAGVAVAYCREEELKRRRAASGLAQRRSATSVSGILRTFENNPTGFERFCADLFRRLGWNAEVTPPVRDGGLDIRLQRGEYTAIVECKLFARTHHIGRPIVQKLVGANEIEKAQGMIVVTTSSFSPDAVSYARRVGVELVDGDRLVRLCQKAWGSFLPAAHVALDAHVLTRDDIMARIPPDLRNQY